MQKANEEDKIIQHLSAEFQSLSNQQLLSLYQKHTEDHDFQRCVAIIRICRQKNYSDPPQTQRILEIYNNMIRLLKIMNQSNSEGWKIQKFGKNKECNLSSKIVSGSRVLIRFDGELEVNVFNLASMIYEADLFHEWIPFCKEASIVKSVGKAAKIVRVAFDPPFISKRESLLFGQGIDRIDCSDSVVIAVEGITNNEAQQERYKISLKVDKGSVAIDIKFFICEITVVKKGIYKFKALCDIDLEMSFIPGFVLKFFINKIGHWIFEKMIDRANHIEGTVYQKRIQEDTQGIYKWLEAKLSKLKKRGLH